GAHGRDRLPPRRPRHRPDLAVLPAGALPPRGGAGRGVTAGGRTAAGAPDRPADASALARSRSADPGAGHLRSAVRDRGPPSGIRGARDAKDGAARLGAEPEGGRAAPESLPGEPPPNRGSAPGGAGAHPAAARGPR